MSSATVQDGRVPLVMRASGSEFDPRSDWLSDGLFEIAA